MRSFCCAIFVALVATATVSGEGSRSAAANDGPIQDNSFLIEEAYNQEDGVIQHISTFQRMTDGSWLYSQTDEWPWRTLQHQISATFLGVHSGDFRGAGFGDTAINYRYQLRGDGDAKVAIAPRISALLPSGDSRYGRGYGGAGVQASLPISIAHSARIVTHWNVGTTWIPRAKNEFGFSAASANVNAGQSTVWLVSRNFNALLETVWASNEIVNGPEKTARQQSLFLNPGMRFAINCRSGLQIVPGVGVPVGVWRSSGQKGVFLYLSFEHPFAWAHSR